MPNMSISMRFISFWTMFNFASYMFRTFQVAMLYVFFLFCLFVILFPSIFDLILSASMEVSLHIHPCPSVLSPCSITDLKWPYYGSLWPKFQILHQP
jgi:ABC-type transport system involved in multi-copper enzyme maturation permease subunit